MIEILKPLDKAIMIGILIWGGTSNRIILSADRQSLETRVSIVFSPSRALLTTLTSTLHNLHLH